MSLRAAFPHAARKLREARRGCTRFLRPHRKPAHSRAPPLAAGAAAGHCRLRGLRHDRGQRAGAAAATDRLRARLAPALPRADRAPDPSRPQVPFRKARRPRPHPRREADHGGLLHALERRQRHFAGTPHRPAGLGRSGNAFGGWYRRAQDRGRRAARSPARYLAAPPAGRAGAPEHRRGRLAGRCHRAAACQSRSAPCAGNPSRRLSRQDRLCRRHGRFRDHARRQPAQPAPFPERTARAACPQAPRGRGDHAHRQSRLVHPRLCIRGRPAGADGLRRTLAGRHPRPDRLQSVVRAEAFPCADGPAPRQGDRRAGRVRLQLARRQGRQHDRRGSLARRARQRRRTAVRSGERQRRLLLRRCVGWAEPEPASRRLDAGRRRHLEPDADPLAPGRRRHRALAAGLGRSRILEHGQGLAHRNAAEPRPP